MYKSLQEIGIVSVGLSKFKENWIKNLIEKNNKEGVYDRVTEDLKVNNKVVILKKGIGNYYKGKIVQNIRWYELKNCY